MLVLERLRALSRDRGTATLIAYRAWQVLSGLCAAFFVVRALDGVEQGFYYTFQNLLQIQVFAELGLTFVITQFASHEMAHLRLEGNRFVGDPVAESRLASLLRSSMSWFGKMSFVMLLIALPVGFAVFSHGAGQAHGSVWQWPWCAVVVLTAMTLALSPLFALYEGAGQIHETTRVRLAMDVAGTVALCGGLVLKGHLFAVAAMAVAKLAINVWWVVGIRRETFLTLARKVRNDARIDWRVEVWPFHWRIALSWLSGFFIFQTLGPILLVVHGAALAGRLGLSMALSGGVMTLSLAFVNARAPTFGTLLAAKKYAELRRVFRTAVEASLGVAVLGYAMLILTIKTLAALRLPVADRVLPWQAMAVLAVAGCASVVGTSAALYLRASKREPLLAVSVAMGLTVPVACYFAARLGNVLTFVATYTVIVTLLLGLAPVVMLLRSPTFKGTDS